MTTLTIATRQSALALWQANHVKSRLETLHPSLNVNLLPMTSRGDHILDVPLAKVGGKGLFVKELETALLDHRADIAVHSMKDVPMVLPEGLVLPVIGEREDPRDAFVSSHYPSIEALPKGAVVGTSSLRRQCQLCALRPDLKITFLRGNVNTRLAKLDAGEYDGIILAAAGLLRLGFGERIREYIETTVSLPAGGQGAIGIECRADDDSIQALIQPIHHEATAACVLAERAMNYRLQGGCQVPIGAFATLNNSRILLKGLVGEPDGSRILRAEASGNAPQALGQAVADDLLSQGAESILASVNLG